MNTCSDPTIHWEFSGTNWTSTKKGWVRDSFNTIDNALDFDGSSLARATEDSGVEVSLVDFTDNTYGKANCSQGTIKLDESKTVDKFYWKVARHEMLHLMGAEHGGDADSKDGENPPTMSTCINWTDFRDANDLSRDDGAYLMFLHSTLAERQIHANVGFERGFSNWGANEGEVIEHDAGGSGGPKHIGFKAESSANSSYVYQTARVWTGSSSKFFRGTFHAKSQASDLTSNAKIAIYYRELVEATPANGCDYRGMITNPNDPTLASGAWTALVGTNLTSVGTSWTALQSNWQGLSGADGYEIQVRVYGKATENDGTVRQIRFDTARSDLQ
ncbi:MAG: hypothetical protein ACSLEW_10490 [Nocardioides sp.]